MPKHFEIDVPIHNTIRVFEAEFQKTATGYRIVVSIEGRDIIFEPDEERNFCAIAKRENYKEYLSDIIQATARVLTHMFQDNQPKG